MADITITEYERLAQDVDCKEIPAGQEPSVAVQQILNPVASADITLSAKTKFVRIHTTAKIHIAVGAGAQTATTTKTPMPADAVEFFGVVSGHHIAAINGA